jgi:hypothetical protein
MTKKNHKQTRTLKLNGIKKEKKNKKPNPKGEKYDRGRNNPQRRNNPHINETCELLTEIEICDKIRRERKNRF